MKCFRTRDLVNFLPHMSIFGPAFDVEILLLSLGYYRSQNASRALQDIVGTLPILFVEDFAQSNFTSNAANPDASYRSQG